MSICCPHCGRTPSGRGFGLELALAPYWVDCSSCGMSGPRMATKREAIEAWNMLDKSAALFGFMELPG